MPPDAAPITHRRQPTVRAPRDSPRAAGTDFRSESPAQPCGRAAHHARILSSAFSRRLITAGPRTGVPDASFGFRFRFGSGSGRGARGQVAAGGRPGPGPRGRDLGRGRGEGREWGREGAGGAGALRTGGLLADDFPQGAAEAGDVLGVVSGPREARRAVVAPERGRWSGVSCATVFHTTTPRAASRRRTSAAGRSRWRKARMADWTRPGAISSVPGHSSTAARRAGRSPCPARPAGPSVAVVAVWWARAAFRPATAAFGGRSSRRRRFLEHGTQPGRQEGEPDGVRAAQEPPAVRQQLAADAAGIHGELAGGVGGVDGVHAPVRGEDLPISSTGLTIPQPEGTWTTETRATSSPMCRAIHLQVQVPVLAQRDDLHRAAGAVAQGVEGGQAGGALVGGRPDALAAAGGEAGDQFVEGAGGVRDDGGVGGRDAEQGAEGRIVDPGSGDPRGPPRARAGRRGPRGSRSRRRVRGRRRAWCPSPPCPGGPSGPPGPRAPCGPWPCRTRGPCRTCGPLVRG